MTGQNGMTATTMTGIMKHSLEEVMLRSRHWQELIPPYIPRPNPQHYELLVECSQKINTFIAKVVHLVQEKVLDHPFLEQCHAYARDLLFQLYKRSLPYLALISENSLIAGSLGFALGVSVTAWTLSAYYAKAYQNVIKSRLMSGVTYDCYRGLESLALKSNLEVPRITNPQQVLIRVHAASVDMTDIAILSGLGRTERRIKGRKHHVLGRDFSGVVLDVGRKVKQFEAGDSVWGALPIASSGSLCEFIVVDSRSVRLKPHVLDHLGAATLPFSSLQVYDAFVKQGSIQPFHGFHRKRILVVDSGSPSGCIAVQVAKAWQGHVTVCTDHYNVTPLMKLLGADRVISLPHDPEKAEIRCQEALNEEDVFDFCLLTTEDSLLNDAFCSEISNVVLKSFGSRRLSSDGYGIFRRAILALWRTVWQSPLHYLDVRPLDHFKHLIETGKLQPVLDSAFAYEQSEEAFQATATNSNVGKTVITFGLRGHQQQRENQSKLSNSVSK